MSLEHLLSLISIVFGFSAVINAKLVIVPKNTESAVGTNVTLQCSSDSDPCEWYHRPIGAITDEILYRGGYMYNGYKARFSVSKRNDKECHLLIRDVQTQDAGLYTCMEEPTDSERKTAEFIVFEKYPSNKTCASKVTCAPVCNDLELSCEMKSHGNIKPFLEWTDVNGNIVRSTLNPDQTTYTVHLRTDIFQPLSYTCKVKYPPGSSSSEFHWTFSTSVSKENKTIVVATTVEENTVPLSVFVTAIVVGIVLLLSLIIIFVWYIWRMKRKARVSTRNIATTETGSLKEKHKSSIERHHKPHEQKPFLTSPALETHVKVEHAPLKVKEYGDSHATISGLVVLDNDVFAVTRDENIVRVFDLNGTTTKRAWIVEGLLNPYDMAACSHKKRIFIYNWKKASKCGEIFSLDKTGKLQSKWSLPMQKGRLSVTKESIIIVTESQKNHIHEYKNRIHEYTDNGMQVATKEIKAAVLKLCDALKMEFGKYVAGFEDKRSNCHEIHIIDNNGASLNSIKNDPAYISARSFAMPKSLAVNSRGDIFVSSVGEEEWCNKVIILNDNLEWKKSFEVAEDKSELRGPLRICLHETTTGDLLLVADSTKEGGKWMDGRIRPKKLMW